MKIKRTADGQVFEGPDGPMPAGFEAVDASPTNAGKPPGVLGIPGARYTQPGEQPQSMPGPLATILENLKKNYPSILGMAAAAPIGGGAIAGPLMRSGAMAAGTGAGRAMQGDPNALGAGALAGATNLAGEGILGTGAAAMQGAFRSKIGKQLSAGLADYLREKVPALANVKNLKDMILGQSAHDAVHEAYDKSLKDLISKSQYGQDIVIPKSLAASLRIPVKGAIDTPAMPEGPGRAAQEMVSVNPADAIANTVGKWRQDPKGYGQMSDILDAAGFGNPEAKAAYKSYMGVKDLMNKSGAIEGNKFNPEKAQAALSDIPIADQLLRRGMQADIKNILLPGGREAIEKGNHKLSGAVLGGGLGAMAGGPLGLLGHGGGAIGGAYLGSKIGQAIPSYSNVIPPGLTAAQGPLAAGIGSAATNAMMPSTETPNE